MTQNEGEILMQGIARAAEAAASAVRAVGTVSASDRAPISHPACLIARSGARLRWQLAYNAHGARPRQ